MYICFNSFHMHVFLPTLEAGAELSRLEAIALYQSTYLYTSL